MKATATWMVSTWLGLIALQALVSRGGSGRVSQAFADLDQVLERVLDPTVPAIPDRRDGAATRTTTTTTRATTETETTIPRLPAVPGSARAV